MQSLKVSSILKYLTIIFTAVPVLVMALVGFFSMSGFSSGLVTQYTGAVGTAQSEGINQVISSYSSSVTYLALSEDFYNFTTNSVSEDSELYKTVGEMLKINNDRDEYILNTVLIRLDGTVWREGEDKQQTNKEIFYAFDDAVGNLSAQQLYVSPIYPANDYYETDTFCIFKKVQMLDIQDGNGFVAAVISTDRIKNILANSSFMKDGYLMVTDGTGTVLNYQGNASSKLDSVSQSDLLTILKNTGSSTTPTAYNAGGYMGNYGYFTGLSGSGWKWVSVYPAGAGAGQITMPIIISIVAMLILAAACVFVGGMVVKSIISPIKVMVDSMNEIKDGDREKRLEVKTNNEFKDMAALFNGMLDDVCMSEELHRTISDLSDNMLFEWDFHKELMFVSDNFVEKFDINPKDCTLSNGKFLDSLMTEETATLYKRNISTLLKNKSGHSAEYQIKTKAGNVVWFSVRTMCITDRVGEPIRVIGVVTDIDSEKKMSLQLSERASYDFLSQLYNRSTFERELQSEIKRNAHTKVAVVFIDIDDFKFINDRFGHSVGDEVIKYVSGCIKDRVKGSGFAGRFGGDEFVLCVTDPEQIEEIESLSLDLIDELYAGYFSEMANVSLNVKASIGIAFSPEHGDNGTQLIAAADEAMYFVKKNGKANYHIYQPEDSEMEGLQHTL